MKPTVENFVKHRLAKMIAKADREGKPLCQMCPGAKMFGGGLAKCGLIEDTWHQACQESVGLEYLDPATVSRICPCHRLGPQEAMERARKAVKKYAV